MDYLNVNYPPPPTDEDFEQHEPPHKIRRIHKVVPRVNYNRGGSDKTRKTLSCTRFAARQDGNDCVTINVRDSSG